MSKKKAIAAAVVRVPQNREEATAMLAEYGTVMRSIEHLETDLNQALADAKKDYIEKASPHVVKADELFRGLQSYCDANRATLTDQGRVKTVDLGTGKVSWRWNPASVKLRGKVEDILARIADAGETYAPFLRATVEIDKVAMLRNPNLAQKIEGVKIASAGETFTVEPFADEQLAESA
jgi:phage host-nuclease inhibitor protein Gam